MKTVEIIFSPTGGTGKVASMISACWNKDVTKIDLSDIKIDLTKCIIDKDDQVLIAMPSFGGRAPEAAIERLKKIAGNGFFYTGINGQTLAGSKYRAVTI